jgi:hypothetical protein
MQGRVWSSLSAAIGAAILSVLFFYGTEYGTWLDEAGRLDTPPPILALPFIVGGLGLLLLIGGLVVTLSTVRRRN